MKIKALLLISIALNALLAFHILRPKPAPIAVTALASGVRAYAPPTQTNSAGPKFNWQSVEADDYQIYIANLRAIGCPEETIQDIVIADVFKLFEERKRQLSASLPKIEYWKPTSGQFGHALQQKAFEAYLKLSQPIDIERNNLLRTLGIDPNAHKLPVSMLNPRELLLDFLTEEKRAQLIRLESRINEEFHAMRANHSGHYLQQAYAKHHQETERRLKELLTPEEALQYDLRFSSTANSMRATLIGFEPTESEFIEIFKLRRPFDEAQSPEANQLDEQIRNVLGESRYDDYTRAGDFGFQQLYKFTQEKGQPVSVAVNAFEIQRAALGKAYELRQGNLDKAALDRALSAIRDETETALQSTLGSDRWNAFVESPFGLNRLNEISRRD